MIQSGLMATKGDLNDMPFHFQVSKLSPSCPHLHRFSYYKAPLYMCAHLPPSSPQMRRCSRMEDNRFLFILGGLSSTATISLGGHGLPFTHWFSNSNNKLCLLHHIIKVKGDQYKVPSTVPGPW